jgi:putative ABC transport system permease protein
VVGVARDTDVWSVLGDPHPVAWVPFTQRYDSFVTVTLRASGEASAAVAALRDALRAADPDLAVSVIGTGRSVLAGPLEFVRGLGLTTLGLGALTLLLAMAGLFGIQSHIVARRTREIGVRMSFGATTKQIRWMVLKDGSKPVIEGMLLGLTTGLIGRVFVRNYLEVDVPVLDPWSLLVVPVPLMLASYCACYLPARRAASVDPNVALRHL